jgi:hypothetical protein
VVYVMQSTGSYAFLDIAYDKLLVLGMHNIEYDVHNLSENKTHNKTCLISKRELKQGTGKKELKEEIPSPSDGERVSPTG